MTTDARIAELEALAVEEGFRLPMAADLIAYFEERGYVVDLQTGEVCYGLCLELSPNAQALCHLYGVTDDDPYYGSIEDDHDWIRRGCP